MHPRWMKILIYICKSEHLNNTLKGKFPYKYKKFVIIYSSMCYFKPLFIWRYFQILFWKYLPIQSSLWGPKQKFSKYSFVFQNYVQIKFCHCLLTSICIYINFFFFLVSGEIKSYSFRTTFDEWLKHDRFFYFGQTTSLSWATSRSESQTCIKTKEHVLQCVTLSKQHREQLKTLERFKYHLQHRWSPSQPPRTPFIIKSDSPFFPRLLSIIFWSPTWSWSLRMGLDLYSNRRFHSGCQKIS